MTTSRGRRVQTVRLLISAVAICIAVPAVVAITGRWVGGWDETLGLVAGIVVGGVGIAWVVTSTRPDARP